MGLFVCNKPLHFAPPSALLLLSFSSDNNQKERARVEWWMNKIIFSRIPHLFLRLYFSIIFFPAQICSDHMPKRKQNPRLTSGTPMIFWSYPCKLFCPFEDQSHVITLCTCVQGTKQDIRSVLSNRRE